MATNPHFNHYYAANEQSLIDSLIIESIQVQGLDVAYIQRTQTNIDFLYSEDPTNVFNTFETIEMWPASVEGFDGEQLMTIFGDEFKKSATFIVSKTRFKEVFPDMIRPKEGDLIFMPITNAVMEIKYVDLESPFFEKGKQYVYELKVEAFEYSYESIQTGDTEIDDILQNMKIDDTELSPEPYSKNDEIDDGTNNSIVFDPSNPFGVR